MTKEQKDEFAEQLRASEKPDAGSTAAAATIEELKVLLANIKPKTTEEMRSYHFSQNIAPRLRDFGFTERYQVLDILDGDDDRCDLQRAILTKLKRKCANVGAIVAMVGPRGTGKTTIAAQFAADRLWEDWQLAVSPQRRGVPCRITSYRKAGDLIARFKAYYGDFGTTQMDSLCSLLEHLSTLECLVIDELHEVPEDSRHKDRFLTDLLDKRYSAKRDTILISNQTREEFWKSTPESIKSRITEHGSVIPCEWESFREKPAAQVHPII